MLKPSATRFDGRSSEALLNCAGALVLVGAIIYFYLPSLRLIGFTDQIEYLIDTIDRTGFWSAAFHSFSFTRVRIIAPGDTGIFRPLYHVFLAFENWLFGAHFSLWQAFGIGIHCITSVQIFLFIGRFFKTAARSTGAMSPWQALQALLAAFALSSFFAFNIKSASMVTWVNVNGVIVAFSLMLGAFNLLFDPAAREPFQVPSRPFRAAAAWVLLCCSIFFNEMGNYVLLILACATAVMKIRQRDRKAAAASFIYFGSIFFIYQAMNIASAWMLGNRFTPDMSFGMIASHLFSAATLINSGRFIAFTLVQPFFPTASEAFFNLRLCVKEPSLEAIHFSFGLIVSAIAIAGICCVAARAVPRLLKQGPAPYISYILLWLTILAVYSGLNVICRLNLRYSPGFLEYNAYYGYLPLALLVLCLGMLWPVSAEQSAGTKSRPWLSAVLSCALLGLAVMSGTIVRTTCAAGAQQLQGLNALVDGINDFISLHKNEKDFSIAFDEQHLKGPIIDGVPLTTVFFKRFENNDNPRYVLTVENGSQRWVDGGAYAASQSLLVKPILPDLAAIGNYFHVYAFQGKYQIKRYRFGYNGSNLPTTAEAPTLDSARAIARSLRAAMGVPASWMPDRVLEPYCSGPAGRRALPEAP